MALARANAPLHIWARQSGNQPVNVIDGHTEPWGTQVTAVEIKDITLSDSMQRAMAKEAEAERERRAKIVAAEGEYQASVKPKSSNDIVHSCLAYLVNRVVDVLNDDHRFLRVGNVAAISIKTLSFVMIF